MTDDRTTPRGDDLAEPAHDDHESYVEENAGSASHSPGMQEEAPQAAELTTSGRAEVPPLRDEKQG